MPHPMSKYQLADEHGKIGEQTALLWLRDLIPTARISISNSLIDLTVNDRPVEIKTCSEYYADAAHAYPRAGRFCFDDLQHKEMQREKGVYLFVVLRDRLNPLIWLTLAADLYYRRQIAWTVAYKARRVNPAILEGVKHG